MSKSDESKLIPVFVQRQKGGGTEFHQLKPHSAPMDRVRLLYLPDGTPIHFHLLLFRSWQEMRLAGFYERSGAIEIRNWSTQANSLIAETAQPSLL